MTEKAEGVAGPRKGAVGDPKIELPGRRLSSQNSSGTGGKQCSSAAFHDQGLLLRAAALEALDVGWAEFQSCCLSLEAGDDAGAVHHFSRLVAIIKHAAGTLVDLRELQQTERAP